MGWDFWTFLCDLAILVLLVAWMVLDRLQLYWRYPKGR